MSQTTLERKHYTKAYPIDTDNSETEFEAPMGNIVGLFVDRFEASIKKHPYLIVEHTKRFTGVKKYGIIIIKDGEETTIPFGYNYVGTIIRPQNLGGFNHIYANNDKERENTLIIPR